MEDFASPTIQTEKKKPFFLKASSQLAGISRVFRGKFPRRNLLGRPQTKRFFFLLLGIVVVVLITTIFLSVRTKDTHTQARQVAGAEQIALDKPLAQEALNKNFSFPLRDDKGKLLGNISYEIQNVELRNQIIINGQRATSIAGREFLILNLKLTNNYEKEISINARDYVRLLRNGTTEKLAPDIHNDPVNVQAISTKYTRLGFPISTTDKNLKLEIGEISGTKQMIPLTIQ